MIYLDNSATTFPKPEPVYSAMDYAQRQLAFNAGRGNYKVASDTQTVPVYLDAACISRYHRAYEKVEQTLHSCRIQGVLSMFRELTSAEQEEFIRLITK